MNDRVPAIQAVQGSLSIPVIWDYDHEQPDVYALIELDRPFNSRYMGL